MAYFLYDSYCYNGIGAAADSFLSRGAVDGLGILQGYVVNSDSSVTYTFLSGSPLAVHTFNYVFPSCSFPGHDMPFLGLGFDDAFLLSMAMVSLMVIASSWHHIVSLLRGR